MLELLEKSALHAEARSDTGQRLAPVAVVGLGYVGLPLAVEFGKHRPTVGYDLSRKKIENIQRRVDTTGEPSTAELEGARFLRVTQDPAALGHAEFVICHKAACAGLAAAARIDHSAHRPETRRNRAHFAARRRRNFLL